MDIKQFSIPYLLYNSCIIHSLARRANFNQRDLSGDQPITGEILVHKCKQTQMHSLSLTLIIQVDGYMKRSRRYQAKNVFMCFSGRGY